MAESKPLGVAAKEFSNNFFFNTSDVEACIKKTLSFRTPPIYYFNSPLTLFTYWLITFCAKPLVSSSLWIGLWMRKRWRFVNCSKSLACTHKKKFPKRKTENTQWKVISHLLWLVDQDIESDSTAYSCRTYKWKESNVKRKSVKWTLRPGKQQSKC